MAMTWTSRAYIPASAFSFCSLDLCICSLDWSIYFHNSHFQISLSLIVKRRRLGKWDTFLNLQLSQLQKEKLLNSFYKERCFNIQALKSSLVLEQCNPFLKVPFSHPLGPQIGILKNKNVLLMRSLSLSLSLPSFSLSLSYTHTRVYWQKVELKLNLSRISFLLSLSLKA